MYFKLAVRNLLKNKTFSFINIFGLTVGTACCIYILLYVQDQHSYDKHHHDVSGLYRVTSWLALPNTQDPKIFATCSPPIAPAIKMDFPEVEAATRICSPPGVEQNLFHVGDKIFYEKKGYLADSNFFRVFDYHFLAGNAQHALDEPYTVVISEKLARKLFNTTDALNQTVGIGSNGGEQQFKVSGVFDNSLGKSHLMPEFFMTMNSGDLGEYVRTDDSWAGNNFIYGYLRLKPGADAKALEAKLPDFLQRHGGDQLRQLNMQKTLYLQPVPDIHTDSDRLTADIEVGTSTSFLNIMLLIAGFIQLVACINFMNLSTARSARRALEVGVRKAVGAGRSTLVRQFMSESILLTLLAVALAIPLIWLTMPLLNRLTGAEVALHFTQNLTGLGLMGALLVFTGLVAGSYPAFYLSSFNPISIFRGMKDSKSQKSAINFRKVLVVSQFVISSTLIIGAIVIHYQIDYMLNQDLGFERSQKIVFPFRTPAAQRQIETFRNELTGFPEAQSASCMLVCPGQFVFNDISMFREGQDMNSTTTLPFTFVDENYLKTLKIKLLAGRFLTPADTGDLKTAKVVINETALKALNIPVEDAPGKVLYRDFRDNHFAMTIVGVMQDYIFLSMTKKLTPFMLLYGSPEQFSNVVVDVSGTDYKTFLKKAEGSWHSLMPETPFEYSFLDEDFAKIYESEKTLSGIISAFTLIAILISCLGLFGLSAFAAEQRTKEVGIRKVLGASVAGITGLLAKDFLKLVVISILIASPIAWYFMHKWLTEFAYRVDIQWWIFALAGVVALSVAFLTVSFQSVKAALMNPVKSLRSE